MFVSVQLLPSTRRAYGKVWAGKFSDSDGHQYTLRSSIGFQWPTSPMLKAKLEMRRVGAKHDIILEWRSLPKELQRTDEQAEAFAMQIREQKQIL